MSNVKNYRFPETCLILILIAIVAPSIAKENFSSKYNGKKENLHIYLLIGQSNMAGRAAYTKEESDNIEGGYLLNAEDQWEVAKNPLNRYSTIKKEGDIQKLNPGYTFTKTMLNNNQTISIGLVVNARGATNINKWKKGSEYYSEALRRTRIAQKSGVLKGILWHQGESNSKDTQYLEKLKVLIANLRLDLDSANLPFVAGQVKSDLTLVNKQIAQLPSVVPYTGFVGSDGLTLMDRWHFDAKSMRLLGQGYAKVILQIHTQQMNEENSAANHKKEN